MTLIVAVFKIPGTEILSAGVDTKLTPDVQKFAKKDTWQICLSWHDLLAKTFLKKQRHSTCHVIVNDVRVQLVGSKIRPRENT
jgi:hypothetical protein